MASDDLVFVGATGVECGVGAAAADEEDERRVCAAFETPLVYFGERSGVFFGVAVAGTDGLAGDVRGFLEVPATGLRVTGEGDSVGALSSSTISMLTLRFGVLATRLCLEVGSIRVEADRESYEMQRETGVV